MTRVSLVTPDIGELEKIALLAAFDSGWIAPAGPDLDAFESEVAAHTGWPGAVAVSNGSAGLHMALLNSGVRQGDVVLVPTFTHVETAIAIAYCGAKPVLIDSTLDYWNISPEILDTAAQWSAKRGKQPKAVVMVDIYGQCADADAFRAVCAKHNMALIEDATDAVGSTYKGRAAGTLGDIGVYSFASDKTITTTCGGMVLAPSTGIAERVRYFATQARERVVHYEHREIGYNYRMSNLLAAVGRVQLHRLGKMIERRRSVYSRYAEGLGNVEGIQFMPIHEWSGWNGWMTCALFEDMKLRDRAMTALAAVEIETGMLWKPVHTHPIFKECT